MVCFAGEDAMKQSASIVKKQNVFIVFTLISLLCSCILLAQDFIQRGSNITLHVARVRSLEHDRRVGFSKALEVYAVDASSSKMSYVLYCVKIAPQAGQNYNSLDAYVSSSYSALHLWPIEKKDIDLPAGSKKRGRMFRVIIFQNINTSTKPDLPCDIYSETAKEQ